MDLKTAETPLKKNILQLSWSNHDGQATVTPQNEDRYTIKVQKVIELLALGKKAENFELQFKLLLNTLGSWFNGRKDLADAYLTSRDGIFSFIAIRSEMKYSESFEDEHADLDIHIANDSDLNLVKLNTMSLPPVSAETLDQFICDDFSFRFVRG